MAAVDVDKSAILSVVDLRSIFVKEQLPFLTQYLTPWQTWWMLSMCITDSWIVYAPLGPVWCMQSISLQIKD